MISNSGVAGGALDRITNEWSNNSGVALLAILDFCKGGLLAVDGAFRSNKFPQLMPIRQIDYSYIIDNKVSHVHCSLWARRRPRASRR